MSVNGTTSSNLQTNMDRDAQEEEMQALEAIFEGTFQYISGTTSDTDKQTTVPPPSSSSSSSSSSSQCIVSSCHLSISLDIAIHEGEEGHHASSSSSSAGRVFISRSLATNHHRRHRYEEQQWEVRYLPPVNLNLQLPADYPSTSSPVLDIDCFYLSTQQLHVWKEELLKIWGDNKGDPIVFTWAEWIKTSGLLCLLHYNTPEEKEGGGVLYVSQGDDNNDDDDDDEEDDLVMRLLKYDAAMALHHFQQTNQTCSICFENKLGIHFIQLDCGHRDFCLQCLSSMAQLFVKEGSIEKIKCPTAGCSQGIISPHILRNHLLSEESYAKWEQLSLSRCLDTMSDSVYCPRCNKPTIEDEDNCAQCASCLFVFCSLCNESWHPGSGCVDEETKLAMLKKKMEGAGTKEALEALRKKEQEAKSMSLIKSTAKQCPSCGMAIMRSQGCNKMTCGSCGAFFCYKCGKQVEGYEHFRAGGAGTGGGSESSSSSPCVLFDDVEIARWELQFQLQAFQMYDDNNNQQDDRVNMGHHQRRGGAREGHMMMMPTMHNNNNNNNNDGSNCPCCGQFNSRVAGNNHMRCYACAGHYCHCCRMPLRKAGGDVVAHYRPGKPCRQHC
jgi:E3 ubiquitin-protein ligase RNF14